MQRLNYEIEIKASPGDVWDTLVLPHTYKVWVRAFSPNSYFEGNWIQGSKIKFLDPDMGGTKAVLEVVEPEKKLLIRHIALISKEGEESTSGEIADKWLGTTEKYLLEGVAAGSKLSIEINTHQDFVSMFNNAWPTAMASIRQLSEEHA